MPRCPFAESGIGTDAMAACPGFHAVPLLFDRGIGESIAATDTCGHMGPVRTSRGFMAGCTHPDAPSIVPVAMATLYQATAGPVHSAL